jgi:hypothetical protein
MGSAAFPASKYTSLPADVDTTDAVESIGGLPGTLMPFVPTAADVVALSFPVMPHAWPDPTVADGGEVDQPAGTDPSERWKA